MSGPFSVFLLMNNYFHDVATAMLLACAVVLWAIGKAGAGDNAAGAYADRMRRSVMHLAWFSVAWIIVSGVIRVATLREFEWKNFAGRGLLPGLVAKYVIAAVIMAAGACGLIKQARRLRNKPPQR